MFYVSGFAVKNTQTYSCVLIVVHRCLSPSLMHGIEDLELSQ